MTVTLTKAPAILPSYGRALVAALLSALGSKRKRFRPGDTIPGSQVALTGVSLGERRLAGYRAVCGFPGDYVPPTWPQVLAFPLHMHLMTRKDFPIPLPGLVHIRNEIEILQPLPLDGAVDLIARIGEVREVERGVEFDLEADVLEHGERIWSARAITLYRCKKGRSGRPPRAREPDFTNAATWSAPSGIGRQYARVSGDYNPIHLAAVTARLLGFKRAIAHGMWTLAASLAKVDAGFEDKPRRIHCAFKLPVMLPAKVRLGWRGGQTGVRFRLEDARSGRPHVEGSVDPV